MDEQNNVDGIRKDDRLSLEGNLEQKDMLNNEQAQSGYDQPGQQQNYSPAGQQPYHGQSDQDSYAQQMQSDGQEYQQRPQYSQPQNYGPAGQQPYQQPQYSTPGQPQNYGSAGQQPYHGQSGYDQQRQWNQDSYAQQMQSDGQEYQQKPQYSQPGQSQIYGPAGQQSYQQPQYSAPGQPQNYGPTGRQPYQQPQYITPGQPQNYGSAGQQPPYGQPGQQPTPYDSPMGYVGYEYRQNVPADVKKGSTHIPNLLNIVGMIMALITVFLPYAHMDSDVRTISGVFGIDVISVIIAAVLLVADIISAFMNKTVAYIIDLVISVIVGGALIFEFVLSLIDLGKLDKTVNAGLSFGAWFSVVTAILLLVSVPVWWAVSRKKAKTEKETAESAV